MSTFFSRYLPPGWQRNLWYFWAISAVVFAWGWTFRPQLNLPPEMLIVAKQETIERPPCAARPATPDRGSTLARLTGRILVDNEDSWKAMRAGLEQLETHPGEQLYAPIFASCIKFQYPPSSLLALDLLQSLFGAAATSNEFLNGISLLLWVSMLYAVWKIARLNAVSTVGFLEGLWPVAFTLTCYPVLKSIELGQIQSWLNAGFALGTLFYLRDRRFLAGLVFGAMATVKPQMALMLPWALVRRDFRMLQGLATATGGLGLIGLVRYGLGPHLEYIDVVRELSRRGESYYANQSINGLLLRLLHLGPNEYFEFDRFAPYHPVVRLMTTAGGLLLMAIGIFAGRRETPSARLLDLGLAGLCFTMASPIAWEHHYGLLPVVFVGAVLAVTKYRPPRARLIWAGLGLSWLLTAIRYASALSLAHTRFNIVESHLFLGAVLLLALLLYLRRTSPEGVPNAEPMPSQNTLS